MLCETEEREALTVDLYEVLDILALRHPPGAAVLRRGHIFEDELNKHTVEAQVVHHKHVERDVESLEQPDGGAEVGVRDRRVVAVRVHRVDEESHPRVEDDVSAQLLVGHAPR